MRIHLLLIAAALAGCFVDEGRDPPAATSGDTTTATSDPTTGEPAGCGDGVVQVGEQCDDGSANASYAACDEQCRQNTCGDGVLGPAELCDDGNAEETDLCSSKCMPPGCGDGIIQAPEQCDDGNAAEDDKCTTLCAEPTCGDGIVSSGEQCDYGEGNSDTGHCTKACLDKQCGDGFIQPGEGCDEGPDDPMDACDATCVLTTCNDKADPLDPGEDCEQADIKDLSCTPFCTTPQCGDGVVSKDEVCDDGNLLDGDDCTKTCTSSICGDGLLDADEDCDDGNTDDGDGCSPACLRNASHVFVSSFTYTGGAVGGLAAADASCQKLAEAAGLPGSYRAWLSDGIVKPATRFKKSLGRPYVLPSSGPGTRATLVADDWIDLIDGELRHAIDINEKGELLPFGLSCADGANLAWTATNRDAGPYDASTHCMLWKTSVLESFGVAGLIGGTNQAWTAGCPMATCDLSAHLYCFEQP